MRTILFMAIAIGASACAKSEAPPRADAPPPATAEAPPVQGGKTSPRAANVVGAGLSREQVSQVIAAHEADARACYDRERKAQALSEGRITVAFTITPSGEVVDPNVTASTFTGHDIDQCLTKEMRKWKFPSPGNEPMKVEYPYDFAAQ